MNRFFRWLLIGVLVAGSLLAWHWLRRASSATGSARPEIGASPPSARKPRDPPETEVPSTDVAGYLRTVLEQLTPSHDPKTNRELLSELRKFLDSVDPRVASQELQAFLAEGMDAATKLDVTIKRGGNLGDASSLRVFLLDYLGQIDRPAAGALAAIILSKYTTPDEWAVCLRNYAWASPDSAAETYLQTKARELLANSDWRKAPTAGFLEAFDVIVYAHGSTLTPELTELVRDKENRATAHAAYLALDRLTINEPIAMLTQLVEQPTLMKGREQTRANYMARADLRDPDQRILVEKYLLDPTRSPEELSTFAGLYPNANYMISHNLLTTVETPEGGQLAAHAREALKIMEQWQNDPRFERLKPLLTRMCERLRALVQPAQGVHQ